MAVDHDSTVALRLLQVAGQRAQGLDNPSFRELRQAVANGVSALQAVPNVDIERIIVRLNALSQTLGELPLGD